MTFFKSALLKGNLVLNCFQVSFALPDPICCLQLWLRMAVTTFSNPSVHIRESGIPILCSIFFRCLRPCLLSTAVAVDGSDDLLQFFFPCNARKSCNLIFCFIFSCCLRPYLLPAAVATDGSDDLLQVFCPCKAIFQSHTLFKFLLLSETLFAACSCGYAWQ